MVLWEQRKKGWEKARKRARGRENEREREREREREIRPPVNAHSLCKRNSIQSITFLNA